MASKSQKNPLTLATMCFSVRMHIRICGVIKGSFYGALQSSELRPNTIVLYVMGKNARLSSN